MRWLGVDVGARWLHLALLAGDGRVAFDVVTPAAFPAWVATHVETQLAPSDTDGRAPRRDAPGVAGLAGAAVDAPATWADDAHADDDRVAAKFRRRCAETVLALRDPPHFVSWASCRADEATDPAHGWMTVGLRVHDRLRSAGVPVVECWPHAAWQRRTGRRRLPSKSTVEGRVVRRAALVDAGLDDRPLHAAGHDHLDAAVAAFTAATLDDAERQRASCPELSHARRGQGIVLPARATL